MKETSETENKMPILLHDNALNMQCIYYVKISMTICLNCCNKIQTVTLFNMKYHFLIQTHGISHDNLTKHYSHQIISINIHP